METLVSCGANDAIEFMLDGDHTGGDYTGSADENWSEEEQKLNGNRIAQQYVAIADTPDGRHVGYQGWRSEWVNALPYADGGGSVAKVLRRLFLNSTSLLLTT